MLIKFYTMMVLAVIMACNASSQDPMKLVEGSKNIQPEEQQAIVCQYIADVIAKYNYKKVPLNDSLSVLVFDSYIKKLDENRNYFLASDIASFDKFRLSMDDDLKSGNLNNAFYIFNVYQKRYTERLKYSLSQVNNDYTFTSDDTFTFDRDSLPWISSTTEMDQKWGQRVKYDLLNLKIANNDLTKSREALKKRYDGQLSQLNKIGSQDVFQFFMDAFTGSVDPHTNYFNPANAAQFNIEMSRSLEGIGASLQLENEYVTIKAIIPGGPAYKSNQIAIDDRIIGVSQSKTGEFEDVVGWRIDNAIALIRGKKGTIVRLKLLSKGKDASGKQKIVEMVREKIILQEQSAKKQIKTYQSNGKAIRIGVIEVPAFYLDFNAMKAGDANYKSTTRDVKLILDTLKKEKVDGVVLDLRMNGGGSLMEAIELTGLFIKTGPVVQVRSLDKVEVDKDEDPDIAWTGPLAIMVDRSSASASEILAAAIQDYGRGLILGTQTYGKGTVQSVIDLDKMINSSLKNMIASVGKKTTVTGNGSQSSFGQINLTVAKFYRINGSSTQHKGVIPDIEFPSVIPLDKYGEDTEPSALPWDEIGKSTYARVGDFAAVKPLLVQKHNDRIKKDPNFQYLVEDIEAFKKRDAEKSVTLNEAILKKQRDADEEKSFQRDNIRRQALGLKPLKKGETKPKNEDLDFMKNEAGQVLTDYINLNTGK
ncbi:MAG: carboxy terminal-processing peptidase [Sphingobacteriaceae bacterium]